MRCIHPRCSAYSTPSLRERRSTPLESGKGPPTLRRVFPPMMRGVVINQALQFRKEHAMSSHQRSRKQSGSGTKVKRNGAKRNVYKEPVGGKPIPRDKSMPKERQPVK